MGPSILCANSRVFGILAQDIRSHSSSCEHGNTHGTRPFLCECEKGQPWPPPRGYRSSGNKPSFVGRCRCARDWFCATTTAPCGCPLATHAFWIFIHVARRNLPNSTNTESVHVVAIPVTDQGFISRPSIDRNPVSLTRTNLMGNVVRCGAAHGE